MICCNCHRDLPHTAANFTAKRRGLSKTCIRCSGTRHKKYQRRLEEPETILDAVGRRIRPDCYMTISGDWPKGRLFNRGEFQRTLADGYWPEGLMVESKGERFVVVGKELVAL